MKLSELLLWQVSRSLNLSFVKRGRNIVSHAFAKFSFSILDIVIWLEDAPMWLQNSLNFD